MARTSGAFGRPFRSIPLLPAAVILRRNRARPAPVPEAVIHRLAGLLDLPDLTEAHQVDYVLDSAV